MNEIAVNRFLKGITSDLDPSVITPDQWVFPTQAVRIINVPGKGFVASMANGTETYFDIPPRTIGNKEYPAYVVGSVHYKDILYLVVVYEHGEDSHTEIGTYGYPIQQRHSGIDKWRIMANSHGNPVSGFQNAYAPLSIIVDEHDRLSVLSKHFGYTKNSVVSVIGKESFDGSFDLYLCDGSNPNYVINSGFNQEGIITERTYAEEEFVSGSLFKNQFLQIRGVSIYPEHKDIAQSNDGTLKNGMYYIYIRYVSTSLDRTAFISEIGPIQVGRGSDLIGLEGGPMDEHSTKTISVGFENQDPTYQYYQIAWVRYYGDLGYRTHESFLITKLYDIQNTRINITGYESLQPISIGEIIRPNIYEKACVDHIGYKNRYVGINWTSKGYDRKAYSELFLKIKPLGTGGMYEPMDDPTREDYTTNNNNHPDKLRYKSYTNTFEYVGYFRGEIYPFGAIALLEDGTVTEAFPITGGEIVNGQLSLPDENKRILGLVKFPMWEDDNILARDMTQLMGLRLDLSAFNHELKDAKYADIKGYYIVRGEKISNLMANGLLYPAATGWQDIDLPQKKKYAPSFGTVPVVSKINGDNDMHPGDNFFYTSGNMQYAPDNINWAFYSPDYTFDYLNEEFGSSDVYVKIHNWGGNNSQARKVHKHSPDNHDPSDFFHEITKVRERKTGKTDAKAYFVPDNFLPALVGDKTWGSYYQRGRYVNVITYGVRRWNRKMRFAKYIGLSFDQALDNVKHASTEGNQLYYGASIYRNNPNGLYATLCDTFTPQSTDYHKISDLILKDDKRNAVTLFKGDCFMQRTSIRALHWHDFQDEEFGEDWPEWKENGGDDISYSHGVILSFISESHVNSAMRDDDKGSETYYPKIAALDYAWVFHREDSYINEAYYYNPGYHRTLSLVSFRGFNDTIPFYIQKRVTRMRHSSEAVPGQFFDSWRSFDIVGYKDFPMESGPFVSLFEHLGLLGSVQERAINRHYVGKEEIRLPSSQADIILGVDDWLSDNIIKLADYGAQHKLAVINADSGVYGLDYRKRVMWVCKAQRSEYGQMHLNVFNMATELLITGELNELLEKLLTAAEVPYDNKGVLLGYDAHNKEVHICILPNKETLIFSETLKNFIGTFPYSTSRFIQKGESLISTGRLDNDSQRLYLHQKEKRDMPEKEGFHDSPPYFKISFVVNGLRQDKDMSMYVKLFDSMEIESLNLPFTNIKLVTTFQEYQGTFMNNHLILPDPEYAEGTWLVPMPVATNGTGIFEEESQLNGTFMIVTLEYKGEKTQFIRNIKTMFNLSSY